GKASLRERWLTSQHLIPGTAKRIDITADVRRLAVASLFRRHVIDGADRCSRASDIRFERVVNGTGKTQVSQFHRAVLFQQQIRRLDVSMNYVVFMRVL